MADCVEEKDKDMAKRILMIALNCMEFSASQRPTMSDVVRLLEGTKHLPLPPKCFLSSSPQASSSIVVPSKRNLELESVRVEEIINPHGEKEKERDGYIIVEIQFKSLGPWGGLGGSEWDDGVFPSILQIEITRDRREICSIEIEYCRNDGMSVGWSNKHGHNTGQQTDKLGKVVGFHGRSGLWLDAIGVHVEDPNN
ncbi:hypothetical protein FRX31_011294 [Thalictrum thalictroides]|uniref:Jacalin-type lectin domain-containing protein n=1 Tax=Thalictrum thalictroides TaxID=46969 RepID=A0A7J6WR85_THATH|nr:hypothetical protein FRX31_011294 [Thalictrum thalictroides]